MSSRLFLELREERALVYDVHTYPSEFRDAGSLTVYAGCDPAQARTTIEVTLAEVKKLLDELPERELAKGKQMARGRIQLRMEDTRSVAGWIGAQELLLGEILTVDEVVARIDAVTRDDLVRVGRELLQPGRAALAVVGPYADSAAFEGLVE
jgi:predicted Zn-dependent peptidase